MMYHWVCMLSHDSGMSIMSMRIAPTASETMNLRRIRATCLRRTASAAAPGSAGAAPSSATSIRYPASWTDRAITPGVTMSGR